jgi:isoleucyl-tRNA synthetase
MRRWPAGPPDARRVAAGRRAAALDRWILSRGAAGRGVGARLADYDALGRLARSATFIDDLSTWYLRLSRARFSRIDDAADRAPRSRRSTALVGRAGSLAPLLPFLSESMYGNLVTTVDAARPTAST